MKQKKVVLGLSGGVDSAVSAHLLLQAGYEVQAVFLECWRSPGCRADDDRRDALKIAQKFNLKFQVLDFKKAYQTQVIDKFISDYQKGLTPNPDVWCNQVIKFGLFYDWAMNEAGGDFVATGHYADIITDQDHHYLAIPKDKHKDQTYFLHQINQDQLKHVLFPLGKLSKSEVRLIATQQNIHVATKKDSVGLCFVGDINVKSLLKEKLGENPGQVIDTQGNVIGQHQGLWFYTIGQRHGFTIQASTLIKQSDGTSINRHNIPPFYVVDKKAQTNQLVVGFGPETEKQTFTVKDLHLINPNRHIANNLQTRIRHTGQLLNCKITPQAENTWLVQLDQPAAGIAPGQYGVFYDGRICLGGGLIYSGSE